MRSHPECRAKASAEAGRRGACIGRSHEQLRVRLAATAEGLGPCEPLYPGRPASTEVDCGGALPSCAQQPAPLLQSRRLCAALARAAWTRMARIVRAPIMAGDSGRGREVVVTLGDGCRHRPWLWP